MKPGSHTLMLVEQPRPALNLRLAQGFDYLFDPRIFEIRIETNAVVMLSMEIKR